LNLIAKFEECEVKAEDKKGGCGSVVGAVSAIGALVIAAAFCLKKKEN
jgi:hypothetical protein